MYFPTLLVESQSNLILELAKFFTSKKKSAKLNSIKIQIVKKKLLSKRFNNTSKYSAFSKGELAVKVSSEDCVTVTVTESGLVLLILVALSTCLVPSKVI